MAMPRLQEQYVKEFAPKLKTELGLDNPMAVPTLTKISIHMSLGKVKDNKEEIEASVRDLTLISGQKPVLTQAKKAIAGFKVRQGEKIGAKVTLRGARMWEFLDKLIAVVMPRTRDFQGLPLTGFDTHGNYTFGLNEQGVFLEIDPNKQDKTRSLQITLVARSGKPEHAKALFEQLGLPLQKG